MALLVSTYETNQQCAFLCVFDVLLGWSYKGIDNDVDKTELFNLEEVKKAYFAQDDSICIELC